MKREVTITVTEEELDNISGWLEDIASAAIEMETSLYRLLDIAKKHKVEYSSSAYDVAKDAAWKGAIAKLLSRTMRIENTLE